MRPLTSNAPPAKATSIPATNPPVIRSPKNNRAPNVTKNGARLLSSVEFATDVNCSDQCQSARSPAKNSPATASNRKSCAARGRRSAAFPVRSNHNHTQRNGSANSNRKNAVALGPTSLNRTSTGAKPMHTAPASSAPNAARSVFPVSTARLYGGDAQPANPSSAAALGHAIAKDPRHLCTRAAEDGHCPLESSRGAFYRFWDATVFHAARRCIGRKG